MYSGVAPNTKSRRCATLEEILYRKKREEERERVPRLSQTPPLDLEMYRAKSALRSIVRRSYPAPRTEKRST